ncbi:MAG: hypothetical protein ACJ8J0_18115 [Longimicrobiaceae bacterium]
MSTNVVDPPYRVDEQGDEIVIRVSSGLMSREEMVDLLDHILLENVRQKASLSDEEIEALAKAVKRSAWERLRPMVEAKLRGRDTVSRKSSDD